MTRIFDRESTLQLIGITKNISTLPDHYARTWEVIEKPDSSTSDLAYIVGTDQASKFQLENGPKWGSRSPLTSFARGSYE